MLCIELQNFGSSSPDHPRLAFWPQALQATSLSQTRRISGEVAQCGHTMLRIKLITVANGMCLECSAYECLDKIWLPT